MKIYVFQLKFNWNLFLRVQLTIFHNFSDNGLAPTRRPAIIWNNDGIVYRRIYASLCLNELRTLQYVIQMTYDIALCHRDEITNLIPKSSVWPSYSQYLIRMTYEHCKMTYNIGLCHPDDITNLIWSLSHLDELAIPSISSRWLMNIAGCHADGLRYWQMSSGWENYKFDP